MSKLNKYKLDTLYEISSGISTKPEQYGNGTPFLSFSTIFSNYFIPDELKELMNTTEKEQELYSIKKGDIFLTRTSETLNELAMSCVALKDYPQATFSGFAKRLRPIQKNITYDKFMGFFLRSKYFRKIIDNNAIMTLRASFNEKIFSYLNVELPEYEEQVKIGNLLHFIEEKIKTNNKINIELEKLAKTLYEYWFVQFDFPDENKRPYKSSGGKMIYNEILKREIPNNWNNGALSDISYTQTGYAFKSCDWKEKGHPVLTIKVIENNSINISEASHIDSYQEKYAKYSVENGNIILAMTGNTIGKIGIIASDIKNILINQRVCIYKTNYSNIAYLYFNLLSEGIQNKIWQIGQNSSQPNISEEQLKILPIVLPPKELLDKYNKIFSSYFRKIVNNNIENQQLSILREFLLPMLINGQVTIQQ